MSIRSLTIDYVSFTGSAGRILELFHLYGDVPQEVDEARDGGSL